MQFFSEEQFMQDPMIVGLATTVLTEIAKRSQWKWLSWVDPTQPNQVKFVAGGLSLFLIIIRKLQTGEFNQGNWLVTLQSLTVSWLMSWVISCASYRSLPYIRRTEKEKLIAEQVFESP